MKHRLRHLGKDSHCIHFSPASSADESVSGNGNNWEKMHQWKWRLRFDIWWETRSTNRRTHNVSELSRFPWEEIKRICFILEAERGRPIQICFWHIKKITKDIILKHMCSFQITGGKKVYVGNNERNHKNYVKCKTLHVIVTFNYKRLERTHRNRRGKDLQLYFR